MTERLSTRWIRHSLLPVLGLCIVGCGNASMSGHVTLDKKPVVFGTLIVIGPDSLPRRAQIGTDGYYSLSDIPPGDVKVAVSSTDPKSMGKNIIHRPGVNPGAGKYDNIQGWFPIPEKFSDFNTSELAYTLSRGGNTIDIDMK